MRPLFLPNTWNESALEGDQFMVLFRPLWLERKTHDQFFLKLRAELLHNLPIGYMLVSDN